MTSSTPHDPAEHLDEESLAAMADGTLSGPARDAAETHLSGCAACRAEVVAVARLVSEGASPSVEPLGFADRIRARIPVGAASSLSTASLARGGRPAEKPMLRVLGVIASLAAAVLVGFGIAWFAASPRADRSPLSIDARDHAPTTGYTADGRPCPDPTTVGASHAARDASAGDVVAPPRPPDLGGNVRYLAHVTTDKPTYRPGERVMARAVILEAFRRTPLAAPTAVGFTVRSARGVEVARVASATDAGVAAFGWEIPAGQEGGQFTLVADASLLGLPTGETTFDVRDYRVPRLRTDLQFVKKAYGPGDEVAATLEATRSEGGIPAGAAVTAVARVDGAEVFRQDGLTIDALGRCAVQFALPKDIAVGEGTLALVIRDGGVQETAAKTIPIVVNKIALALAPEGGDLVASVPCRVYFEARTPKQEPADVAGRVLDAGGSEVTRFESVHEGRGRFGFVPKAGASYRVVLDKPAGIVQEFALPAVQATGFSLVARSDETAADEAVRVDVTSPAAGAASVVLYQRERELSVKTIRLDAGVPAAVALSAGDASGVLRVTVFDAQGVPRAERLVFRRPAHVVHVAMAVEQDGTVPGGKVNVSVKTTDDRGRAVPAVVGIAATDDALLATIDPRERAPRLPVQALLGAEVRELRDARLYLGDDLESARRVDLLLGTQGWRRFGFAKPDEFETSTGDIAIRAMARRRAFAAPSIDLVISDVVNDEENPLFGGEGRETRKPFDDQSRLRVLVAQLAWKREHDVKFKFAEPNEVFAKGDAEERAKNVPEAAAAAPADGPPPLAPPRGPGAPVPAAAALAPVVDPAAPEVPAAPPAVAASPPPVQPPAVVVPVVEPQKPKGQPMAEAAMREGRFEGPQNNGLIGAGGGKPGGAFGGRFEQHRKRLRDQNETDDDAPTYDFTTATVTPVWSRIFAHGVAVNRPADARTDFTETVYWNAGLRTGADGRATFSFDASDAVTTVRVRGDAFTADGALGEADATVEVRRPFYVEPKFPLEVTAGDRVQLPISLVNGTSSPLSGKVTIDVGGGLTLTDDGHRVTELNVPARGSIRAVVELDVGAKAGQAKIHLVAEAGAWKDEVVREIRVVPAGFPVAQEFGGVLEGSVEHELDIPADVAPGSLTTSASVFPTPLASLTEALAALLREPCGCFEQTSSTNYPNVMALQYLKSHHGVDPALVKRAADLAAKGYQRLVAFETKERGYEWFGGAPGHEALTAYGVLEFMDMATVTSVDADMLARTRGWLLARRDGKGGFSRNARALDSFGGAPEDVTNAYIVWALVEAGEKGLDVEVGKLKALAATSEDPYLLGLAANTLAKLGDDAAGGLRERLTKMQGKDGAVAGAKTSITGSGGDSLTMETTSLAILAWLPSATHVKNVESAMTWLAAHCKSGRFGSTQATILALKAILAYDARHARPASAGTVTASIDGHLVASAPFTADAQGAIVVPSFSDKLTAGHHRITLAIDGGSVMPYALTVRYHAATPPSSSESAIDVRTTIAKTDVAEGEPVEVPVTVTNRSAAGVPIAVAIVGLPGGIEARPEALKALVKEGTVDAFETRGREVILYWRGFAPKASRSVTIPCIAAVPGSYTGPASRAYLYYTDEHKVWVPGLAVVVRPR